MVIGSWKIIATSGYAAGGGADINARELANIESPLIGQQIVVDNKGGAAQRRRARRRRGQPDGQTLFYAVGTNVIINPWVQKGMIDTIATLAPICQTTAYQYVLAVNPKVAANSAAELVALAKKDPEKLTYSSSGVGGNNHLAGALFADAAGIKLTHVPYKGTGPALADVISGVITMNFSSLPPAVGQVKAGNLKALASPATGAIKSLPDVPTLKEQGIDVVVNGWHGLFAPAKTPDAILDKIEKDTKQAMKLEQTVKLIFRVLRFNFSDCRSLLLSRIASLPRSHSSSPLLPGSCTSCSASATVLRASVTNDAENRVSPADSSPLLPRWIYHHIGDQLREMLPASSRRCICGTRLAMAPGVKSPSIQTPIPRPATHRLRSGCSLRKIADEA
ncbi:tripartite tricarboxylate transporter substrate binding protein [Levilactobacillus brevis]